jgi:type II secretory pathway pseudopilin PulG
MGAITTTTAIILGLSAVAAGGVTAAATTSAANKNAKAAQSAADAQKAVGLAQIEAPIKAEQAAAESAKAMLKLRQASKSNNILSGPLTESVNKSNPSILGVPQ